TKHCMASPSTAVQSIARLACSWQCSLKMSYDRRHLVLVQKACQKVDWFGGTTDISARAIVDYFEGPAL
ncbi:MAG: hypothetical protein ACPL7K_00130, partial [Armatimonadota bacterium]